MQREQSRQEKKNTASEQFLFKISQRELALLYKGEAGEGFP
jgi:hypothetical protein